MKPLHKIIALAVAVVAFFGLLWTWGFCRFYVRPDQMAVIIAKTGEPLPPGQILARKGQMGIQEEVLGEGRHFRDPIAYDRHILPVVVIPPGKVGIVTSKVGAELPQGEFLANEGEKGILRRVLGPGKYRLNPYGYEIKIEDAVVVPIGYVGVLTSLSGRQAEEGAFAKSGEKGVRADILQPGLYYVNPKEYQVAIVEIGVNQVSLLGREGGAVITKSEITIQNVAMEALQDKMLQEQKAQRRDYYRKAEAEAPQRALAAPVASKKPLLDKDRGDDSTHILNEYVTFPSRDGFQISLDMTLEFELAPANIAWLFRSYGDLPAVVDKIIMPQILSVSRNKGSEYRAKDFIVGEGREKFQKEMTDALSKTMAEKRIITHNALIRHVDVPMQILDPIQKASLATEQDLTNKERQNTAKKQAELNTSQSLIDQRRQQVAQETQKLKAEIAATQEKQVAQIRAEAIRKVAEIEKTTAGTRAATTRTLGKAAADALKLVEGERARGANLKTQAFGDPAAYSLWELAGSLNPAVRINILHAGAGTLWTDLEKAGLGDLGGARMLKKPASSP
jgi:regulator of protease activity HflC (stomatin/prohibitin superfamily)